MLVGLVVSVTVLVIGAVIALVFGLLWVRDLFTTHPVTAAEPGIDEKPRAATVADLGEPVDRATFLSLSTIGVGALIGAGITLPALGFAVLPSFDGEGIATRDVNLGPITNFPEGQYVIATFLENPDQGEVSRRTAFVRNNGRTDDGVPSFTTIYSHEHTRIEASKWMADNIPPGSAVASETWDDILPLPYSGASFLGYQHVEFKIYDDAPPEEKAQYIAETLIASDYVVLSSDRVIESVDNLPWRYGVQNEYYRRLLDGQLGFQLVLMDDDEFTGGTVATGLAERQWSPGLDADEQGELARVR